MEEAAPGVSCRGIAGRVLPEDAGRRVRTGRWKRKGGGGLVVRIGFRDVDSPPSSSTMMTV